jgi:hypothetical protein
VVSASAGIVDALEPGSVVAVPCDDPTALRTAVLQLMERPDEAARLAERAREMVLRDRTLARWVSRIAEGCAEVDRVKQRS